MQVELSENDRLRLLDAVLKGVGDPILIFSDQGLLILANAAAEKVFSGAVAGATLETVLADPVFAEAVRSANLPHEWMTHEGSFVFQPKLVVEHADEASPSQYVLVLKDVTSLKRLVHNQDEFVHIVSHDLRTPLTTIKGYTGMIGSGGALNERQTGYVAKVMSGIHQLTSLVDNIQDAGRFDMESGFYLTNRDQCDVTEIVRRVVHNYVIPPEKQDLELTVDIAPDVPIINADGNMLERAIVNLVDNAVKYTPNGGKTTVRVYREEDRLVISVTDTGLGIAQEDLKKLFQRHSRINREEFKRIKGTGLGLFIVRSVALRHGGEAWVQSKLNEGSTFAFYIPLTGQNLVFNSEA